MVARRAIRVSIRALAAALALAGLAACGDESAAAPGETAAKGERLGLFSSLPIYWGEGEDFGALIDGGAEPGPVRQAFEHRYALVPIDALEADNLESLERVILAQPRPLAPSENFALDQWVRAGGQALVFADPVLTAHSGFGLGDPRRPQDMVLISPILARWGLELRYDEDQPAGRREVAALGASVVVDQAGTFALKSGGEDSDCTVSDGGLVAQCRVGSGRVTLVADAAMLDLEDGHQSGEPSGAPAAPPPPIDLLLDASFAR